MKKTDFEALSLMLLASACGQVPDAEERGTPASTTANQPNATGPANEDEKTGKAVRPPMVKSQGPSVAIPALGRTGRGGGRSLSEEDGSIRAPGRTGRTGGKTDDQ